MKGNKNNVIFLLLFTLFVIAGAIKLEQTALKVVSTGANLVRLNDNARVYNEQPIKTDKMTVEHERELEERQSYYNSEDWLIRTYSNAFSLVKIFFLVVALVVIVGVPVAIVWMIIYIIAVWGYTRQLEHRYRKTEGELYGYKLAIEMLAHEEEKAKKKKKQS